MFIVGETTDDVSDSIRSVGKLQSARARLLKHRTFTARVVKFLREAIERATQSLHDVAKLLVVHRMGNSLAC